MSNFLNIAVALVAIIPSMALLLGFFVWIASVTASEDTKNNNE